MKLRYYLRGLGTGIIVTALILGRLISESRPLTDAEIKAKALTLGMVDANSLSLSDVGGNGNDLQDSLNVDSETGTPEPEVNKAPGTDPDDSDNPGITDSPDPVTSSVPPSSPDVTSATTTPTPDFTESVTIEIFRGDSSYTVSMRLEEAGLVADAREFDAYLVDNGYSRSIRAGTYTIPIGASWEEIVDIIS